jgi:hypothetical protein
MHDFVKDTHEINDSMHDFVKDAHEINKITHEISNVMREI